MMPWFKNRINKNPNKKFIKYKNNSFSYSDLYNNISMIKKVFDASGIIHQEKIIILLPNGIELIESIIPLSYLLKGLCE